jgi:hypothetical protein
VTELGGSADKSGKDNNYRDLAVYDGVVYFTKGSGSNGVDTVYFADPTGSATVANGVGLPSDSETLPSASSWTPPTYSTREATLGLTAKNPGLTPTNSYILKGFPTALAKDATDASDYPFGRADPNKLVEITDSLGASTASQVTHEQFHTVMQATYGQVVRGVAFTPGTPVTDGNNTSPQPSHPHDSSGQPAGREEG